jgi:hypothetical protein
LKLAVRSEVVGCVHFSISLHGNLNSTMCFQQTRLRDHSRFLATCEMFFCTELPKPLGRICYANVCSTLVISETFDALMTPD